DHRRGNALEEPFPLVAQRLHAEFGSAYRFGSAALEEAESQLFPPGRPGLWRGPSEQLIHGLGHRGDFGLVGTEWPVINPHGVDQTVKPPLRTVAASDAQRLLRRETLVEQVEQNLL